MMGRRSVGIVLLCVVGSGVSVMVSPRASARAPESWIDAYREPAARIIRAATADDTAWQRLAELGDTAGARLAGSTDLATAIKWAADKMRADGLENVRTEPAMVPHWVRGEESAEIVRPSRHKLAMLGLGRSVGTGPSGIEAEVLVVRSFDELDATRETARGRIVVYNPPYTGYGEAVRYRSTGAVPAARYGAVAALVRSAGPEGLRTPHTGGTSYGDSPTRIPIAAIAAEDAAQLQRMQDRGWRPVVHLRMGAETFPDVESANVIAEIVGREKPNEVVVIGGHLDGWDGSMGAHDDGGACIAMWEALRTLKNLGLTPRRTIRVVLFVDEELAQGGGRAYRDRHRDELANHVMMLESDAGVFRPVGFGLTGNDRARASVTEIAMLLKEIGADRIGPSGGGVDIRPSVEVGRMPSMSLDVDGANYFLIHHTTADTIERVVPADLAKCVAAVAVMSYVIADMPMRLGQ